VLDLVPLHDSTTEGAMLKTRISDVIEKQPKFNIINFSTS
jgi:hypothetical protein